MDLDEFEILMTELKCMQRAYKQVEVLHRIIIVQIFTQPVCTFLSAILLTIKNILICRITHTRQYMFKKNINAIDNWIETNKMYA